MTRAHAKKLGEPRRRLWLVTGEREAIRVEILPEPEVTRLIWVWETVSVTIAPGMHGKYYLDFSAWDNVTRSGLPLLAGPFTLEQLHRFLHNAPLFMEYHCQDVLKALSESRDWGRRMEEMEYALSFDPDDKPEPEPELLTDRDADFLDWEEANRRRRRSGRTCQADAPYPFGGSMSAAKAFRARGWRVADGRVARLAGSGV